MNLKQKLSSKMKKTGGFTLIEMLIVVAIIAILIAVSIPLVSNSLDKARKSTDAANERAAKAAALAEYMLNNKTGSVTYTYDATNGKAVENGTAPAAYGQCSLHKEGYVQVVVKDNPGTDEKAVTVTWGGCGAGGTNVLDSTTLIGENTDDGKSNGQ